MKKKTSFREFGVLVALFCMVVPLSAETSGNFNYDDNGTSITISGVVAKPVGAVVIPATINGKPVTTIGPIAFWGSVGMTGVTIPNSVTSIENKAFSSCGLTSVTIPNSVTSIGNGAFEYCRGLTSVTIPTSVTSIEDYAFSDCSSLTSVTIPNSVTIIGWSVFGNCSSLTSVTIPNSVTSIGGYAFSYSSLTSVTIPNSVTSIGWNAFSYCSSLTSLTIPNSVTSIGSGAFSDCTSLTRVTIPNSVTSIERGAFSGCSGLTSVTVPNSVTSIGDNAFSYCSKLGSAEFLGNGPTLGANVFDAAASGFAVYYHTGASGFTTPTWNGYKSVIGTPPTPTPTPNPTPTPAPNPTGNFTGNYTDGKNLTAIADVTGNYKGTTTGKSTPRTYNVDVAMDDSGKLTVMGTATGIANKDGGPLVSGSLGSVKTVDDKPYAALKGSFKGTVDGKPITSAGAASGDLDFQASGNQTQLGGTASGSAVVDGKKSVAKPTAGNINVPAADVAKLKKSWGLTLSLVEVPATAKVKKYVTANGTLRLTSGESSEFSPKKVTYSAKTGYLVSFASGYKKDATGAYVWVKVLKNGVLIDKLDAKGQKIHVLDKKSTVKISKMLLNQSGSAWVPASGTMEYKFLGQKGKGDVASFLD